jgi:hypothetical protein
VEHSEWLTIRLTGYLLLVLTATVRLLELRYQTNGYRKGAPFMIEFTDDEKNCVKEASAEAQIAQVRLQTTQRLLVDQEREVIAKTSGLRQTIRTILKLKGVNPDAYQVTIAEDGNLTLELKVPSGES